MNILKEEFFEKNSEFKELEFDEASIGDLHNISEDNEFWLLQCPKNIPITQLNEHKLKLPGRTKCSEVETVAVEFDDPKKHAFGYVSRKRKKCLCLLPIRGSIIVRTRIPAKTAIDYETIHTIQPKPKKVVMPEVKLRHPLLGSQYEDKLNIKKKILHDLKSADENNLKIMRNHLVNIQCSNNSSLKPKRKRKVDGTLIKGSRYSPTFEVPDDLKWIRDL